MLAYGGFMSSLQVGDVVRLKSGGPLMTVKSTDSKDAYGKGGYIDCQYFSSDKLLEETFTEPVLKKVSSD